MKGKNSTIDGIVSNGKKNERYDITLEDVQGIIFSFQRKGKEGYILSDGTELTENERNEDGFYRGSIEANDTASGKSDYYEPQRNEEGKIIGFRKMSEHLAAFTGEEQKLIFQYALNTKEHLLEDLREILNVVQNPEICQMIYRVCEKLSPLSESECVRLMADIRFAYKSRNLESIRQRQKTMQKNRF